MHPQCIGLFYFMAQLDMTVRNGKFYRGSIEVPIEHGNKEQIALLKRVQEMQEGFYPEVYIKKSIHMEFRCVCGALNEFESFSELDVDDPEEMIRGETDNCHYCGLKFKVIIMEDDLALKVIKKSEANG